MIADVAEIAVAALLVAAGLFGLIGSFGLLKLTDLMMRLHAPTKTATLGVGGVLAASVLAAALRGTPSLHEVIIALFLFLTAPVTAHFIAKLHLHRHLTPADLPPTGGDTGWAGYDDPATLTVEAASADPAGPLHRAATPPG